PFGVWGSADAELLLEALEQRVAVQCRRVRCAAALEGSDRLVAGPARIVGVRWDEGEQLVGVGLDLLPSGPGQPLRERRRQPLLESDLVPDRTKLRLGGPPLQGTVLLGDLLLLG